MKTLTTLLIAALVTSTLSASDIYGNDGKKQGEVDRGDIYDNSGRYKGYVDDDGEIYGSDGRKRGK